MGKKKKIAILYGGRSVEHQISIRSARNIAEYINKDLFNPFLIGISLEGTWYHTHEVTSKIDEGKELKIRMNSGTREFIDLEGNSITIDIAFPVLHGTDGEDGSIQGLLKAMNIPCVGSDVLGSAISMNKLISKQLMQQADIPVCDFVEIRKNTSIEPDVIVSKLGLPVVIKPTSLGSSVGVNIARSAEEITSYIEEAFEYDSSVMVEQFVEGREIECSVMGNDNPQASLPGEIVVAGNYDFYSFDAKYVDPDAAQLDIPANIDQELTEQIRNLCVKSFLALKCCDYARVDLFLTEKGDIFINEINTIPGFTNSSMFPKMWENMGISYQDLITKLIELAIERDDEARKLNRVFKSNLEA